MTNPDVFGQLLDDIRARDRKGREQHDNRTLTPDTHLDNLQEAYEECLDMAVYLKAEIMRRKRIREICDEV